MIVSVPSSNSKFAHCKACQLETEPARRTARRAQVKQLKSEKLSPCSRGNLEDSNACASTTARSRPLSTSKVLFLETPKTGSVLILLRGQRLFAKSTIRCAVHFTLFSDGTHSRPQSHSA